MNRRLREALSPPPLLIKTVLCLEQARECLELLMDMQPAECNHDDEEDCDCFSLAIDVRGVHYLLSATTGSLGSNFIMPDLESHLPTLEVTLDAIVATLPDNAEEAAEQLAQDLRKKSQEVKPNPKAVVPDAIKVRFREFL